MSRSCPSFVAWSWCWTRCRTRSWWRRWRRFGVGAGTTTRCGRCGGRWWRGWCSGTVRVPRWCASADSGPGRNPALLAVCGFEALPRQGRVRRFVERVDGVSRVVSVSGACRDSVPSHWNFSRFVRRLVELEARAGVFEAMMRRLGEQLREALPDFGEHPRFRGGRLRGTTGRRRPVTRPVGCRLARGPRRTAMRIGAVTRRGGWMVAPVGRGRRSSHGSATGCI